MPDAGFVLAGGRSSRMGRDKALLAYRGRTLLDHVAGIVREAAGSVSVIGDPAHYARFGYPVHGDRVPPCGPAGGIYTALSASPADWNVIVACDMPGVTVDLLRALLGKTEGHLGKCVIPLGPDGEPEPLCGVYHVRCLPALERAIREKRFKMKDLIQELEPVLVPAAGGCFSNVNTPEEWAQMGENVR